MSGSPTFAPFWEEGVIRIDNTDNEGEVGGILFI